MKEQLITELEATTKDLFETLSLFTQEAFNTVPFEGSWTAGQVAEHLFKSESNLPRVLNSHAIPTERDPLEKAAMIQAIFLDYTKKFQAPEFILPSEGPKNKDHFIQTFEGSRKELHNLTETTDLTRTFTDFPFFQLGELTGWEWVCFAVCHSKRHIRQLKNIAEKLKQ